MSPHWSGALHTPAAALVCRRTARPWVWRSTSRDKAFCYALLIWPVGGGSAHTWRCSWCWNTLNHFHGRLWTWMLSSAGTCHIWTTNKCHVTPWLAPALWPRSFTSGYIQTFLSEYTDDKRFPVLRLAAWPWRRSRGRGARWCGRGSSVGWWEASAWTAGHDSSVCTVEELWHV